jgi:hypothetical protein
VGVSVAAGEGWALAEYVGRASGVCSLSGANALLIDPITHNTKITPSPMGVRVNLRAMLTAYEWPATLFAQGFQPIQPE